MRLITIALLLSIAPALLAEEKDKQANANRIVEEILVTGTRLQRRDAFSLSPIVTVDREDIVLQGAVETKSFLNDLPQVDPGPGGNEFPHPDHGRDQGTGPSGGLIA